MRALPAACRFNFFVVCCITIFQLGLLLLNLHLFGTIPQNFIGRLTVDNIIVAPHQGGAFNSFLSHLLRKRTDKRFRRADQGALHG